MSISSLVTSGYICDPSSVTNVVTVDSEISGVVTDDQCLIGVISEDCEAAPFEILTFNAGVSLAKEIGDSIINPPFTATYVRPPTSAILSDNDGNAPVSVVSTPNAFNAPYTYLKTGNNESVTWTLTADDGTGPDTAVRTATWRPLVFVGVSANAGPYTEVEIEALTGNLQANATFSGQLSPSTEYIVYAFPTSYGPKTPGDFEIGNFGPGDMSQVQTLSITNGFGVTQSYDIWRSDNILNFPNLDFTVS